MASKRQVQKLSFAGLEVQPALRIGSQPKRKKPLNKAEQREKVKRKKYEREVRAKKQKYQKERGSALNLKGVQDKKARRMIKQTEKAVEESVDKAARAEILLPAVSGYLTADDPMEETWRFKQGHITPHLDLRSKQKVFDLKLDQFGPYSLDYTRNGRFMLLGGRKGHIATMDWARFSLKTEFHVKETIRDVQYLHDDTMFAVAQKKYVYIYDHNGIELHCLRNHIEPNVLDFLPYHFLLVSAGKAGYLKYQDTSTGALVAEHRTRMGECNAMRQNPHNAVMCLGHTNGQVTMWSPNMSQPLVQILAHKGRVQDLAVDVSGHHMVTSGLDGQVKVWDVRTFKELHSYFSIRPASTLDISQNGLLATACGPHVQVWKDALRTKQRSPYLVQKYNGKTVQQARFCPFEDVLGLGHSMGVASMVVPGAGEANFDTFEANPFQSKKQRKEATVHNLLEKLQPDMIGLDPTAMATLDPRTVEQKQKDKDAALDALLEDESVSKRKKKAIRRRRRQRANIIDRKTKERKERVALQKKKRQVTACHDTDWGTLPSARPLAMQGERSEGGAAETAGAGQERVGSLQEVNTTNSVSESTSIAGSLN